MPTTSYSEGLVSRTPCGLTNTILLDGLTSHLKKRLVHRPRPRPHLLTLSRAQAMMSLLPLLTVAHAARTVKWEVKTTGSAPAPAASTNGLQIRRTPSSDVS